VSEKISVPARRVHAFGKIFLGFSLISVLAAAGLWAAGDTSANFLKIPAGARATALGQAYTALADDASAIYWNPAGLSSLKSNEFLISHNIWFQDIQHSYAAVAVPLDANTFPRPFAKNTLGLAVTYLDMGAIERRASNTASPDGSFSANDLAVSLAFSRNILNISGRPLSLGVALKYIRQTIDKYSADSAAADAGLLYPFSIGRVPFRAGAVVQNLGTSEKFIDQSYPLPLTYKAGVSFLPLEAYRQPLCVSFDVEFPNDNDTSWKLGAEYVAARVISLRLGYASRIADVKDVITGSSFGSSSSATSAFTGFTAGVGFSIPLSRGSSSSSDRINVDYAFAPYGELGDTHTISLGIKW